MIISAIYKYFNIENNAEITIEANPEDITYKKLNYIKKNGVNRLSIGIQSFVKKDLVYLKRNHSVKQSIQAVENALNAGFSNINLDFIIGLPVQTQKTLEYNFSKLKDLDTSHVSVYILEEVKKDKYSENRDNDLYFFAKKYLESIGYIHYEVSNFSKNGFQSKHNLKYWKDKNYIGIGLSASSYENNIDHKNFDNFDDYFNKIENKKIPYKESKTIKHDVRKIITGLRMIDGISIENFKNHKEELKFLEENNFVKIEKNRVSIVQTKILLLNEILTYFL
jgi:oxygen-independent coproporphyrinogen-3 oxidase